ncbi:hypothetical protein MMC29_006986 [Sticta canariensis]|nr:hypothetical protein [Sticta canariensis]
MAMDSALSPLEMNLMEMKAAAARNAADIAKTTPARNHAEAYVSGHNLLMRGQAEQTDMHRQPDGNWHDLHDLRCVMHKYRSQTHCSQAFSMLRQGAMSCKQVLQQWELASLE